MAEAGNPGLRFYTRAGREVSKNCSGGSGWPIQTSANYKFPRNPNASACSLIAAIHVVMCSSSGTPSSSAPFTMSSRLTALAKALSFIRFFTELASRSRMLFDGRT